MANIYLIRHCEAEGQPPEAALTERGEFQAQVLAEFLSDVRIDRILSSPFKRAVDTIHPLATKLAIEVEVEDRLSERVLSTVNLPDWFEKLKLTFDELDLKFEGGESSQEAMNRIADVVEEVFSGDAQNTIIVSHGNLLSLLIKHFQPNFGFEEWGKLSNPDVYLLKKESNKVTLERIWNSHNGH